MNIELWMQEHELHEKIQTHALERNYIRLNERKRTSSLLEMKIWQKVERSYMKNHGWKWSTIWGPKWYFADIYKRILQRFRKGLLLQQAIPLPKHITNSDSFWLTRVGIKEEVRYLLSDQPIKGHKTVGMHAIFY